MSSVATNPIALRVSAGGRPVALVCCCTVLGAAAQILMKMGAGHLVQPGMLGFILGTITNPLLMAGYCLYGVNTVMLAMALRDGELSMLYPIIALTYVWVTMLSYFIFHDRLNVLRIAGVTAIVIGVAVLGRGSRE